MRDAGPAAQAEPEPEPAPGPGLRQRIGSVRDSASRLVGAHVELLKAELDVIVDEIKVIGALVAVIVAIAIFAATLAAIGSTLFLGEWLFGSMAWGVVHGVLLSVTIIVIAALVLIETPSGVIGVAVSWGIALAIIVACVLGANLARQAATWAADRLRAGAWTTLPVDWGPAIVGVIAGAILVGLLLFLVLARLGGAGPALVGLVLGAILGIPLGWELAGVEFSWQGAAAIGIMVGLFACPLMLARGAMTAGVDPTARFRRLLPRRSYDAALESKRWLEEQWTKRRG